MREWVVTWTSSDVSVAGVDSTGVVTAVGNGAATVVAAAGTVAGSAAVTVTQEVSTISVSSPDGPLVVGDTLRLVAEARDANGSSVASAVFLWESGDESVATVDSAGLVDAIGAGQVAIAVTSGSASGSATVTVGLPPDDRHALEALYWATNGPNWENSANPDISQDEVGTGLQ